MKAATIYWSQPSSFSYRGIRIAFPRNQNSLSKECKRSFQGL